MEKPFELGVRYFYPLLFKPQIPGLAFLPKQSAEGDCYLRVKHEGPVQPAWQMQVFGAVHVWRELQGDEAQAENQDTANTLSEGTQSRRTNIERAFYTLGHHQLSQ